jgi:hypothetical protein
MDPSTLESTALLSHKNIRRRNYQKAALFNVIDLTNSLTSALNEPHITINRRIAQKWLKA